MGGLGTRLTYEYNVCKADVDLVWAMTSHCVCACKFLVRTLNASDMLPGCCQIKVVHYTAED